MTVLHATEASTVHLSAAARVEDITPSIIDAALHDDRTLVKQLAMRRTLFVFPKDLLPAAWGSASARVAAAEGRRIARAIAAAGIAKDGEQWLDTASRAVLGRLEDGPATVAQLRADVVELAGTVGGDTDKTWDRPTPVAPWVLTHLGLRGVAVRGRNAGHWRLNKPTWARTEDWIGQPPTPLDPAAGYAELVRRWLATFGPGTAADVQWWLGATKAATTLALSDVEAEQVDLDDGTTGWVLPGDVRETEEPGPWAALLPTLDPTTMGWKQRAFHLPPEHVPYLFDSNGNGGTTAWVNGRVVGCWVQDADAVVQLSLLEEVDPSARAALAREAERLTSWLAGVVPMSPYTSPQMKQARLP